jgi:hypothetical protein
MSPSRRSRRSLRSIAGTMDGAFVINKVSSLRPLSTTYRLLTRVGNKGNTSQAVVEFAPHQKIPVAPVKEDPRQGTIEEGELPLA